MSVATNLARHLHTKCRGPFYPKTKDEVRRVPVPDDKVDWQVSYPEYSPTQFTADELLCGRPWADPPLNSAGFTPKFNELNGAVDRRSHMGQYTVLHGVPLNPHGRTGIAGRGVLGRWGPNHAADPIVTRWRRQNGAVATHPDSKKSILEVVLIHRGDCGELAIPGGMVDPGENVSQTLKREFGEEALNSKMSLSEEEKRKTAAALESLFHTAGVEVYRGYVDDPRNTDNAWMETVAVNFHDETGAATGAVELSAGDDAVGVQWVQLNGEVQLYASHRDFLQTVVQRHGAHW